MKYVSYALIAVACLLAFGWWRAGRGLQPLTDAARARAPGEFVELSSGKIHYRLRGPEGAPLVVMVHGFSTPHFIFEQNAAALNAAGMRTLQFDHFGRGWSDRPGGKYDIAFYDRELQEILDALAPGERVGLAGLSMGGPIVTEFAARHPERVSRVFLFVPAGFDISGSDSATTKLIRTPIIGDYLWRLNWRKTLLSDPQYKEDTLAPEDRLQGDFNEQLQFQGYSTALLSSLRHFPMHDREDTYQRFAQTGLVMKAVFGDADPTVLIASADRLNAAVPSAEIRVLPGADHGLNYKRHKDVNEDLVRFFTVEAGQPTD